MVPSLDLEDERGASVSQRRRVSWTDCVGRWPAQAQIASNMFQDSQFILANLILFSQDEFAVMLLDLNTISLYHRAKEL